MGPRAVTRSVPSSAPPFVLASLIALVASPALSACSPLAAGRHTVSFKWPDGKTQQKAVEVKEGKPSFVEGRKE